MGFPGSSDGKASSYNEGDLGSIPGLGRSLEKEMATHSSIHAWKVPWTKEPESIGSQRVGHDWATSLFQGSYWVGEPTGTSPRHLDTSQTLWYHPIQLSTKWCYSADWIWFLFLLLTSSMTLGRSPVGLGSGVCTVMGNVSFSPGCKDEIKCSAPCLAHGKFSVKQKEWYSAN